MITVQFQSLLACAHHIGCVAHCSALYSDFKTSGEAMHTNAKNSAVQCKSLGYHPMCIILAVCGVSVAVVREGGIGNETCQQK